MRALHLDYQAARPRSRLALGLLVIAVAIAASALWRFEQLRQERAVWEAERALTQSRAPQGATANRDRAQGTRLAQETAAANAVIRRIQFPWAEMFGAFEAAAGEDVALIGIEPDANKGVVRLTVEARNARNMLHYVRRLQRTAFLEQVLLQKHELRTEDPDKPLRFTVVAKWKARD